METISKEAFQKLNEKEKRLTAARYAMEYGHGGIIEMARRYSLSRNTVRKGIRELQAGDTYTEGARVRSEGAGRPKAAEKYPGLKEDVLKIADETCFMIEGSSKKQLGTSCRKIAARLQDKYQKKFSPSTIQYILWDNGYECPRSKKGRKEDQQA